MSNCCINEKDVTLCETDDVLEGASHEAQRLSVDERQAILSVLTREGKLRSLHEKHIMRLRAELQLLRRKGALKVTNEPGTSCPDPDRSCARCRTELGRIINRGAICRSCRMRVCKNCREYSLNNTDWICSVCYKRKELQAVSGEWMQEFARGPGRKRDARSHLPVADLIKKTIRRSWTISNTTSRWSTLRGSPLMRPYCSLPRGQDINAYTSLSAYIPGPRIPNTSRGAPLPTPYDPLAPQHRHSPAPRRWIRTSSTTTSDDESDQQNSTSWPEVEVAIIEMGSYKEEGFPFDDEQGLPKPVKLGACGSWWVKPGVDAKRLAYPESTDSSPLLALKNPVQQEASDEPDQMLPSPRMKRVREEATEMKKEPPSPEPVQDTPSTSSKISHAISKALHAMERSFLNDDSSDSSSGAISSDQIESPPTTSTDGDPIIESMDPTMENRDTPGKSETVGDDSTFTAAMSSAGLETGEVRYAQEVAVEMPGNELSDVEALTGTVFKKVAIRRRRQDIRKLAAVDNGWSRTRRGNRTSESVRVGESVDLLDILLPEGEDYRLVFLSSDSSSKEEDVDDNDSSSTTSTAHSFPIDECDWDYFEPGARPVLSRASPWGSPRVYRRTALDSPLGSPLVCRRARESDTGTDDDNARLDSPASSDSLGYLARVRESSESEDHADVLRNETIMEEIAVQCVHQQTETAVTEAPPHPPCQSCGAPTQNFFIPVPVPIPVPIPALWNSQESVILYSPENLEQTIRSRLRALSRHSAWLWPYLHQGSLISPLISGGEAIPLLSALQLGSQVSERAVYTASMPVASDQNNTPVNVQQQQPVLHNDGETSVGEASSVSHAGQEPHEDQMTNASKQEVEGAPELYGYLISENTYMSSSDSSAEDGDSEDGASKPRVQRMYNVSGAADARESDDALPSSNVTTDCEEEDEENDAGSLSRQSSAKEEDATSSGSADTDTDDTGTVADQKPKRFHRVFVVNNSVGSSSSDVESNTDSSSDTDTSDNDTDTERDCRITLTYMKPLPESELLDGDQSKDNPSSDCDEPVILLKHTKSENETLDDAVGSNPVGECCSRDMENGSETCDMISDILEAPLDDASGADAAPETGGGEPLKTKAKNNEKVTERQIESDNNTAVSFRAAAADLEIKIDGNENVSPAANQSCNSDDGGELIDNCKDVACHEESDSIDLETAAPGDAASDAAAAVEQLNVNEEEEKVQSRCGSSSDNGEDVKSIDIEDVDSDDSEANSDLAVTASAKPVAAPRSSKSGADGNKVDESAVLLRNSSEESEIVCAAASKVSRSTANGVSEWNTSAGIRSSDPVSSGTGTGATTCGERAGASVASEYADGAPRHAARYTSLVMITQEQPPAYQQVSVVTSDTTKVVPGSNDVVVKHTNWMQNNKNSDDKESNLPGYYKLTLDNNAANSAPAAAEIGEDKDGVTVVTSADTLLLAKQDESAQSKESVTVVTGANTLSAVVCLEEGLADDDSWVEDLSHDEDDFGANTPTDDDSSSGEEVTLSCTVIDQEEELRGYHRAAIDFTLHTIVEESCEESEVELNSYNKKMRPASATDLEKYFFFGLGDGNILQNANREDALSETSSNCSEGLDSMGTVDENMPSENNNMESNDLASSRLEKYFLSGFMGFTAERRDSDGSVGSDSEGRPSPEQRRKRLVRARGTGRSHSSSLDNLLANPELSGAEQPSETQADSESSSSSETDVCDEAPNSFEKSDGQFDTVKRKKGKKQRNLINGTNSPAEDKNSRENTIIEETGTNTLSEEDTDGHKTPQPEFLLPNSADLSNGNRIQQSRDSGFVGSCDDLLKDQRTDATSNHHINKHELKIELEKICEEKRLEENHERFNPLSTPPATSLTRKDSFNNWSSDEETNLMMSKMRQFFKTMVANSSLQQANQPSTAIVGPHGSPRPIPSPRLKNRSKPPQLVYFENELTRLMKTVPGIRDDQVREIVEYLSSEDTWSDSYDSSDYTSSDLEGGSVGRKSALQQQISDSCQQIISKFDANGDDVTNDILGAEDSQGLNKETAFVYQKLVASLEKMAVGEKCTSAEDDADNPHSSPPLIAKVMHHIGSRLVALMHEVSSGESHASSNSPKARYHRRLQQKLSNASTTTTEDDDSTSDSNLPDRLTALEDSVGHYNILPRSRSHDLLLGEARAHHQSSSGVSDIAEERETSDYERFSWRGSFESALMATDSRTKLSLLGGEASASALAIAAKRRSAGDLLFSHKSLSREQLDRVRSCGSIGGGNSEDKLWVASAVRPTRRRSSVPDATCGSGGSADGEDDDEEEDLEGRSTLPRSLQSGTATTNSLPRLPTSTLTANIQKAQSMHHVHQQNVKSARYRPPGFNRTTNIAPKRAVSAPGLQLPSHQRRDPRRRNQQPPVNADESNISEANSSPLIAHRGGTKSSSPSPVGTAGGRIPGSGSASSVEWHSNEDDIDRLVSIHHNRTTLSSLGLRSDSMASVYSGAGEGRYGTVTVRGQVEFGLQYNYKAGALEILIKQCKDLASVDQKRNRSDPYVKVYLLPDKSKGGKRKTKVKKHTLNPVFDETLKFNIPLNALETRTLWLTVWHSDMFGRNDFLGEVMLSLQNKVFDDPTPKWYSLQERTEPFEDMLSYKGDILVGLKFVPPDISVYKKGKRSRGALHILVKEARSLTAVKGNACSDPFCKSYLLPDKGRSSKQKTPVIRRTTNPVWNYTFVYDDVSLQELAERSLELTIWDHDRLASNEFLGGIRFSLGTGKHYNRAVDWMDSSGKEVALWKSMLERPNLWVEGCLSLRPTLDNRTT